MKKQVYNLGLVALLGSGVLVNAQTKEKGAVGVNTEAPQATLDVNTFDANGTTNEGIIAPKLTKERVANIKTPVEGTLVYVTNATYSGTNAAVSKIDDKGYYYFDGKVWVKAKGAAAQAVGTINGLTKDGDNVKLGGTLTEATDIALNGKNLTTSGEGNVGIGTSDPTAKLEVDGTVKLKSSEAGESAYVFSSNSRVGVGGMIHTQKDPSSEDAIKQGFKEFTVSTGGVKPRWILGFVPDVSKPDELSENSVLTVSGESNVGINMPGASLPSTTLDVNGKARIREIEEGDTANNFVLLADTQGNIKKAAASGLSENLYTNNGTLAGNRTVTQNNNDLTFSTGTGKFILEGNAKIASTVSVAPKTDGVAESELHTGLAKTAAAGRTIRVYDGSNVPNYTNTDYMIVLTNPDIDGHLELPSAKANPGRIIYLLNGCVQGLGFSNTGTDDVYPFNFGTISVSSGVAFVSTGKTWYVIGR